MFDDVSVLVCILVIRVIGGIVNEDLKLLEFLDIVCVLKIWLKDMGLFVRVVVVDVIGR